MLNLSTPEELEASVSGEASGDCREGDEDEDEKAYVRWQLSSNFSMHSV
jgi:hypothetical protein